MIDASGPRVAARASISAVDSATVVRATRYSLMNVAVGMLAVVALVAALYLARGFFVPLLLGAPLVAIAKAICDRVESLKPAGELLGR